MWQTRVPAKVAPLPLVISQSVIHFAILGLGKLMTRLLLQGRHIMSSFYPRQKI